MGESAAGLAGDVAEAGNVLSRLGLVTAYGHVSARTGTTMLITPAADLALVSAADVLEVPLEPGPGLPAGVPAEAWAHLALYRARPDAAAVARAQPPAAFAAAAAVSDLVPLHGQAAWLGESVPVHGDARLLRSPEWAERADKNLPGGAAGQVTPLSPEEIASWRAVGDELLPRLWQHLRHRVSRVGGAGQGGAGQVQG